MDDRDANRQADDVSDRLSLEVAARRSVDSILQIGLNGERDARIEGDQAIASLIGQAGTIEVAVYDTRLAASFSFIKTTSNSLITNGFSTPGDQGGATYYRKSALEMDMPGDFVSSGNVRWGIADPILNVRSFGAKGDRITNDTVAVKEAQTLAKILQRPVDWGVGGYILSETVELPAGIQQIGHGGGAWLSWSCALEKLPAPTELIFIGSGPRVHTQKYVTDMRSAGGVVANPSSRDGNDQSYSLTSFMNDDGTLRKFSCAVKTETSGRGITIRDMRIVLNHPSASELHGIGGYNDPETVHQGDDWDVGFWNQSGQNLILSNVHVVGYWRMFGAIQTAVIDNDTATSGGGRTGSEYSRYIYCNFQGAVGFGIRGGDSYRIDEVGDNYVAIEDSPNLPFKLEGSGGIKLGKNENSAATFRYYMSDRVRGKTRLYIVENLAGINVGDVLISNIFGFGTSNTVVQDCEIAGYNHASGRRATQLEMPLSKPSAAFEGSGAFVRGITFRGTKFLGREDVLWHMHEIADVTMDSQTIVEAKIDTYTKTVGGRCIASPSPSSNDRANSPMGQTDGLRLEFISSQTNNHNDLRPRSGLSAPTRFGNAEDYGLFSPQSIRWLDQLIPPQKLNSVIQGPPRGALVLRDADDLLRVHIGAQLTIGDSSGQARLTIDPAGKLSSLLGGGAGISLHGNSITPTLDDALSLGTGTFRWQQIYAATSAISTSDEREKDHIQKIEDTILDAWADVEWCQFKFKDRVRLHIGLVAQHVKMIFESRGIDPFEYGILCFDEWDTPDEVLIGTNSNLETSQTSSGDRYGIRYEEALALEAAYQRRELSRLKTLTAVLSRQVGGS
ncbi:hypothetical protein FHS21_006213 [Phyllobacterium trifolii]|uniref:Peptidase S74 domain-containing protein n=1 Tax=Phyllobacterium trifolii TaxID=300193 RepID=A0A839UMP0_9HYPH|nr:tail fiber domain-containing protein [Phyllobacterium trifolii]MBB3149759.1 hypothetical protein [Phyllobacterium trifolii]